MLGSDQPLFWCFLRRQQAQGTRLEVTQALGLPDVSLPSRLTVMLYNAERCLAACRTGLYFFSPLPRPLGSPVAVFSCATHRAALKVIQTCTLGRETHWPHLVPASCCLPSPVASYLLTSPFPSWPSFPMREEGEGFGAEKNLGDVCVPYPTGQDRMDPPGELNLEYPH